MKISYFTLVLITSLLLSCASNKSTTNDDSNANETSASQEQMSNASELSDDTTLAEGNSDDNELSEAEQQALVLEEQRIQAEKDAAEERERLEELRRQMEKEKEKPVLQTATEDQPDASMNKENNGLEENEINRSELNDHELVQSELKETENEVTKGPEDYYAQGDFVIQFFASVHENKEFEELSKFGNIIIQEVSNKSIYRYNIGFFRNRIEAEIVLEEVKGIGWTDAFVREK